MKLTIGEYEVEIKAKNTWHERFNQEDTFNFLNELSIAFSEAGKWNQIQGYDSFTKNFETKDKDIYKFLSDKCIYD